MSATADHAEEQENPAAKLGFQSGQVVQELGYDDDTDEDLREGIVAITGVELVDEDYEEDVADAVVLWFRQDDGDLAEALMDALTTITDGGHVWLMTPKTGRDGYVDPAEIGEAAPIAGLTRTTGVNASKDWSATRLVAPKTARSGGRK